jgi:hypothetical protein
MVASTFPSAKTREEGMYRRGTGEWDRVVIHREEKMCFDKSGAGVQGCSPGVVSFTVVQNKYSTSRVLVRYRIVSSSCQAS